MTVAHLAPWTTLLEALSSEVVRKLRLAGEADTKDDRDIICEEVFCDVTGLLDETAQAQLGMPARVPFYVVLAQHYATPRGADSAVAVLHLLQGLYGQGYAAPLMALLLHRWLLLRKAPGRGLPEEQCTRLANVLALGSAQLFLGDVHGGARAFEPLWRTLCYEVILGAPEAPPRPPGAPSPLPSAGNLSASGPALPSAAAAAAAGDPHASPPAPAAAAESWPQGGGKAAQGAAGLASPTGAAAGGPATGLASLSVVARTGILASVASYLVYYSHSDELQDLLCHFPSPTAPPAPSLPTPLTSTSPSQQQLQARSAGGAAAAGAAAAAGGGRPASSSGAAAAPAAAARRPPLASPPWAGVDFVLSEVVDTLMRIRSEAGLVHYLGALQRLAGQPVLQQWGVVRLDTRLRLQSTLYALSSPGGPHYAPPAVRAAALAALDRLFPAGRTSRYLVRMLFRLLHPADWIGDVVHSPLAWLRSALSRLALSCFLLLHSLVLWGAWGGARGREGGRGGGGAEGKEGRRDGGVPRPAVLGGEAEEAVAAAAAAAVPASSGSGQPHRGASSAMAWAGGAASSPRVRPVGKAVDADAAHLAAAHPGAPH